MRSLRIYSAGLTNSSSEDYGTFATSHVVLKKEYVHWCTSHKCTRYVGYRANTKGVPIPVYMNKMKVHKFTKHEEIRDCPDCGHTLVIK